MRHVSCCLGIPLIIALLWGFLAAPARAQTWVEVELRDLPSQCVRPRSCVSESRFALRTLMSLAPEERETLIGVLGNLSDISDLPERTPRPSAALLPEMVTVLHPLPKAEKHAPLVDHPGVYFDSTRMDAAPETTGFSTVIRHQLTEAGLTFLTEDAWQDMPGRPTLSVRFTPRRQSAGCIIPFSLSMAIYEEAVLARNPALKVKATTWSTRAQEDLSNLNYTHAHALEEVVRRFLADWTSANPN